MRPSLISPLSGVSGSNSFTSSAIYAWDLVRASFQVFSTVGGFHGTVKFQASNQLPVGTKPQAFQPTQWTDIGSSSITASSSGLSQALEMSYGYIRVVGQSDIADASTISVNVKLMSL